MKTKSFVFALAITLLVILTTPCIAQDFKVVVNQDNPMTSIDADHLSRIFLKKTATWPNGVTAVPIDQSSKSDVRRAFSSSVHRRDVDSIKAYWQRMVFSGKAVPPVEMASDDEVLSAVRSNVGGVGYVSASTKVRDGVKVIEVTSR